MFEEDFYSRQKLIELRILNIEQYEIKVNSIFGNIGEHILWFVPIKQGHKLCIKCLGMNGEYVLGIKSCSSKNTCESWHDVLSNPILECSVNKAIKELELMNEITYYDDLQIYIQKFCVSRTDLTSFEFRKNVLRKIAKIHSLSYELDVKSNPFNRYEIIENNLHKEDRGRVKRITNQIVTIKKKYMNNKMVLSHGDCHHGNIVFNEGKCIFIDWEFLCYTYEYYDICRFLFYSQFDEYSEDVDAYNEDITVLYAGLHKYIKVYKEILNEKEIVAASEMLFLCEAIELLLKINRKQENIYEFIQIVEDHIDFVKER